MGLHVFSETVVSSVASGNAVESSVAMHTVAVSGSGTLQVLYQGLGPQQICQSNLTSAVSGRAQGVVLLQQGTDKGT